MNRNKEASNSPKPVERTSAGLRDAIFDEIDAIRDGTSNPTRANSVAKLAAGVVDTVRMEMEFQRHLRQVSEEGEDAQPARTEIGAPLALGRKS